MVLLASLPSALFGSALMSSMVLMKSCRATQSAVCPGNWTQTDLYLLKLKHLAEIRIHLQRDGLRDGFEELSKVSSNIHSPKIRWLNAYGIHPRILHRNMAESAERDISVVKVVLPAILIMLDLAIREAESILRDDIAGESTKCVRDSEDRAVLFELAHAVDEDAAFFLDQSLLVEDGAAGEAARNQLDITGTISR